MRGMVKRRPALVVRRLNWDSPVQYQVSEDVYGPVAGRYMNRASTFARVDERVRIERLMRVIENGRGCGFILRGES